MQIESHLAELANPSETYLENGNATISKRFILGGDETALYKQGWLKEFLHHDASAANDAILDELTSEKDCFNKYLATSIDFFNNYLFGKDEDNFKQVVIRGLIREYKEYVLPDADDASQSPVGRLARAIKDNARELQSGKRPVTPAAATAAACTSEVRAVSKMANSPAVKPPAAQVKPPHAPQVNTNAHTKSPTQTHEKQAYNNSEVMQGTVVKVTDAGALINFGKNQLGFANINNIPHAQYRKIGLCKGQKVNCAIRGKNDKGRTTLAVVA